MSTTTLRAGRTSCGSLTLAICIWLGNLLPAAAQIALPPPPGASHPARAGVLDIAPDPPSLEADPKPAAPFAAIRRRDPHARAVSDAAEALEQTPDDTQSGVIDELAADLRSAREREAHRFDAIQQRLEQLREINLHWKHRAEQEEQQRQAERRRAAQAEQVAEEARQSAEQAHQLAVETMRKLEVMRREIVSRAEAAAIEPSVLPGLTEPEAGARSGAASDPLSRAADAAADGAPTASDEPGEAPYAEQASQMSALPITDGPIDRAALADSLFGAQKFQLAVKIYEQLLTEENLPEEAAWLRYQVAGCYRNVGDWAAAEKNYRMVAGSKSEPFLAETSRWWLAAIQEQREVSQTLARWQDFLSAQGESTK